MTAPAAERKRKTSDRDLPDGYRIFNSWRDTGCEASPSCLTCPLSHCRYDELRDDVRAAPAADPARLARDAEILAFASTNSVAATAAHFRVSRRTIFRVSSGRR